MRRPVVPQRVCAILQVGPQVRRFLEDHLGNRLASPALIPKIGNRFRAEVRAFAAQESIPVLRLKKPDRTRWDDRKPDHVRPWLDKAGSEGRFGVVAIVAAQEFQFVYSAARRTGASGGVYFVFTKEERRAGVYYFYVLDREFGPGFIKICTYFPYPAKICLLTELRHVAAAQSVDGSSISAATLTEMSRSANRCSPDPGLGLRQSGHLVLNGMPTFSSLPLVEVSLDVCVSILTCGDDRTLKFTLIVQRMAERARVGQAPGTASAGALRRAGQRVRLLRSAGAAAGDLRPLRPG